jgi:DNA replication and repair protein RecF
MFIRSLYVHHFRNYEEAYFEFDPQLNLICGLNAQGKTNLLEALHYSMTGRSFRTSRGIELIKDCARNFYVEIIFTKYGVDQSLKIAFDGLERRIIYNHTPLNSAAALLGIIPFVLTSPDDVNLVKGSPLLRRQFLDLQISQIDPLYVHHLTRYVRAVKQRNQLLKAKRMMTIESWEHEMSQSAAYLVEQRYRTIRDLQRHCEHVHAELIGEPEQLSIVYKSGVDEQLSLSDIRAYYLEQLYKNRTREMFMGHTLVGPHKDDLLFLINQKEVRFFASEGQQRTCMTTIHLAEWHRLSQAGHEKPIMMLDDVGLSLDPERRKKLLNQFTHLGQIFLTSTDQTLLNELTSSKKHFYIQKGECKSHAATTS